MDDAWWLDWFLTVVDCFLVTGWVDTDTYTAETGWIDEAKIQKYCFPPSEDTLLFVCGLPPMYQVLSFTHFPNANFQQTMCCDRNPHASCRHGQVCARHLANKE